MKLYVFHFNLETTFWQWKYILSCVVLLVVVFCNHMWRMQNVESANFLSHISVPHPQPSVLIVSYIESAKAAAQFGFYQKAEWKPDDSMIAVAVSTQLHLLILYLQFD